MKKTKSIREADRPIHVMAPDSLHRELKQAALDDGLTVKELVIKAAREMLARRKEVRA